MQKDKGISGKGSSWAGMPHGEARSRRVQCVAAILLLCVTILPFFVLANYAGPSADDFSYANTLLGYRKESHTFLEAGLRFIG